MGWDDLIENVNKVVTDTYGETVVYHYQNESSQEVVAIFDDIFKQIDPNTGAIVQLSEPMIGIKANLMLQEPYERDKVTVRGIKYRVIEAKQDGQGMYRLRLIRDDEDE